MGKTDHTIDYGWKPTPWWVFWRPKWCRLAFGSRDRGAPLFIQYATDEQVARVFLEDTFGRQKTN